MFSATQCAGFLGGVLAWSQEAWPVGLALPLCVRVCAVLLQRDRTVENKPVLSLLRRRSRSRRIQRFHRRPSPPLHGLRAA